MVVSARVVVDDRQILVVPVIGLGMGFTLRAAVALQPVGNV